jgi:hypothetical protein
MAKSGVRVPVESAAVTRIKAEADFNTKLYGTRASNTMRSLYVSAKATRDQGLEAKKAAAIQGYANLLGSGAEMWMLGSQLKKPGSGEMTPEGKATVLKY